MRSAGTLAFQRIRLLRCHPSVARPDCRRLRFSDRDVNSAGKCDEDFNGRNERRFAGYAMEKLPEILRSTGTGMNPAGRIPGVHERCFDGTRVSSVT